MFKKGEVIVWKQEFRRRNNYAIVISQFVHDGRQYVVAEHNSSPCLFVETETGFVPA